MSQILQVYLKSVQKRPKVSKSIQKRQKVFKSVQKRPNVEIIGISNAGDDFSVLPDVSDNTSIDMSMHCVIH